MFPQYFDFHEINTLILGAVMATRTLLSLIGTLASHAVKKRFDFKSLLLFGFVISSLATLSQGLLAGIPVAFISLTLKQFFMALGTQ